MLDRKIINKIVKNKTHCIFVSPHLDDAVLSCGGLINYLSKKTKVTVINVFTKAGSRPYTMSAKSFLKKCGFKDAKELYRERVKEDQGIFNNLKVSTVNLNLVEALWRKNDSHNTFIKSISKIIPEVRHTYKTYRFHIKKGKVSSKDNKTLDNLEKLLRKKIKGKNIQLFCPAAVGKHVDHILVRKVCNKISQNTILWSDYPYNTQKKNTQSKLDRNKYKEVGFDKYQDRRKKLIKGYKTQVNGLFGNGEIKLIPEKYFVRPSVKIKPKVVVVIPRAWNEEKNIVPLINSIKKQSRSNYILERIEVYSDGSTDKTVERVRKHHKDVKTFDFKDNLGKNKRVNQMLNSFSSDVLVQIDADIEIKDKYCLDNLIKPYAEGRNPGIVCAYHLANKPDSFMGKVAYFGFLRWDKARKLLGDKGVRYYCEGGMRAFSSDFVRSFLLPVDKHIGEDSYSFYFAVSNGYDVELAINARVYIDLPDSLKDYVKQMKRFLTDKDMVSENFNNKLINEHETLDGTTALMATVLELVKRPVTGTTYLILQSLIMLQMPLYRPDINWEPIGRK